MSDYDIFKGKLGDNFARIIGLYNEKLLDNIIDAYIEEENYSEPEYELLKGKYIILKQDKIIILQYDGDKREILAKTINQKNILSTHHKLVMNTKKDVHWGDDIPFVECKKIAITMANDEKYEFNMPELKEEYDVAFFKSNLKRYKHVMEELM